MDPYLLYWMSEMEQKESHDKNMEDEFWEFMLECYNLYQKKWRKSSLSLSYDNNRNPQ
jgi:hypothetical protein